MTIQQLTPLAKKYGVKRLHSLCKDDMIEILFHRMLKDEVGVQKKQDPFVEIFQESEQNSAESPASESEKNEKQKSSEKKNEKSAEREVTASENHSAKKIQKFSSEAGAPAASGGRPSVKFPFAAGMSEEKSSPAGKGRLEELHARLSQVHDLAYLSDAVSGDIREESLLVEVLDPYWLHVTWCLRRITIERARIALGHLWFDAKPALSVTLVTESESGGMIHRHLQYIDIHGGVNHWFINVNDPPGVYQVEIGYLAPGRFFSLQKGNIVQTPHVRSALRYEHPKEAELILGELEPADAPEWSPNDRNMYLHWQQKSSAGAVGAGWSAGRNGDNPSGNWGASADGRKKPVRRVVEDHPFEIETEMIIYGMTSPDSQVTVDQEWVAVQPDGTFMLRFDLPEQGRQMLTIDSTNREESRKIILTLERTTKVMEPKMLDEGMIEF